MFKREAYKSYYTYCERRFLSLGKSGMNSSSTRLPQLSHKIYYLLITPITPTLEQLNAMKVIRKQKREISPTQANPRHFTYQKSTNIMRAIRTSR